MTFATLAQAQKPLALDKALALPKECTFTPATSAAVTRAIVAELLAQDRDSC